MNEPISSKKFIKGYTNSLGWIKAFSIGSKFLIIIFVIYAVWKVFNPDATQDIKAEKGSTVNIFNKEKRNWWIPSPFVEIYTFKESDRSGSGGRFGARWEF